MKTDNKRIKLICISDSNYRYTNGKWYFADLHYASEEDTRLYGFRTSYWVYDDDRCLGTGGRYYVDRKEPGDRKLDNSFCTIQEARRMKLKQIESNEAVD